MSNKYPAQYSNQAPNPDRSDGLPPTTVPSARPSSVTVATLTAFAYSVLVFGSGAMTIVLMRDTAIGVGLGAVDILAAVALAFCATISWRGQSGNPLMVAALVILVINGGSMIFSVLNGGNPLIGIIGLFVPGVIYANIADIRSREYFAAHGDRIDASTRDRRRTSDGAGVLRGEILLRRGRPVVHRDSD